VRPFVLFLLIGGFAAAVNFFARMLIEEVTSYEVAIVLAFPVALTTAFVLNRLLVFKPGGSAWTGQYGRFAVVNLLALVQVFVVSVGLARFILPALGVHWHAEDLAHAIGVCSPVLTSYWAHKHYSFAPAGKLGVETMADE
jgi:putative flippase GtrA